MMTFGVGDQLYDICSTPAPINRKATFKIPSCRSAMQQENKSAISKQQKLKKVEFQKLRQKQQDQETNQGLESKTTFSQASIPEFTCGFKNIQTFQSDILKGVLDLKVGPYNLKRIFKASAHNFDVKKFHELCGTVENTVTIAEINNGNIVGGYTPLSWEDNYNTALTHYKSDKQSKSFVINFTSKQKYTLIKQTHNKAIVGCKYLGPTFGGGYDFSIGNFANKKYSSSCDFPTSYCKQAGLKNLKLNRRSLIGISQEIFLIKQWEVFQVCLKEQNTLEGTTQKDELKSTIKQDEEDKCLQNQSLSDKSFWKPLLQFFLRGMQKKNDEQV